MSARRWALALLAAPAIGGCFTGHVDGSFRATSEAGASWQLEPNHCVSGAHAGYVGGDMYRDQAGDDTEVVVLRDGGGFRVLARVPHAGKMVALTPADCRVFEAAADYNGVSVNDVPAIAGSVRIDCTRPEIGHVTGEARFVCY